MFASTVYWTYIIAPRQYYYFIALTVQYPETKRTSDSLFFKYDFIIIGFTLPNMWSDAFDLDMPSFDVDYGLHNMKII